MNRYKGHGSGVTTRGHKMHELRGASLGSDVVGIKGVGVPWLKRHGRLGSITKASSYRIFKKRKAKQNKITLNAFFPPDAIFLSKPPLLPH